MFLDKINVERLGNKILYLIAQKSTMFKVGVTVMFCCLLFTGWLFFYIRPLHAKLRICSRTLKQLNTIKNSCSQSYDHCTELSKRIELIETKLNKKITDIGTLNVYGNIKLVIDCMTSNGLVLVHYSPVKVEKIDHKQKLLSETLETQPIQKNIQHGKKVSFEFTMEGVFINIFNFFKCLSKMKYGIKYRKFSITQNEQGLITCNMLLDIFQITK